MEIPKRGNPIQRLPLLKNISKANHDILVFCLNINLGLRNQVEITQINPYINHIVEEFLFANFQFKKLFLTPLVQNEEKAIKQSNDFWERFIVLKNNPKKSVEEIQEFETLIYTQIRVEERILLNNIQNNATLEQIQQLAQNFQKQTQSCLN